MRVIHEHCAGLDVHKKAITACAITPEGREIRTFGTTTRELLEMADWLQSKGVVHVAMESTGVYWKPVFNLLEGAGFEPCVVNAQHIKAVRGRKTDVKDAEWIAELHQHGLLRASFIPTRGQRELRELVRYRRDLVQERAREVNRIQKVLEGANIKLGDVATDVLGKSGRAMLDAIVCGVTDPESLAALAKGRLRHKKEQLEQALLGLVGPHQRTLLGMQLQHLDALDQQLHQLNHEVQEQMRLFVWAIEAIDAIPGIGRRVAEEVLAEIGVDMNQFPSAKHLASWAALCPGSDESAGKRRSGRTGKGNLHVRSSLVEAAHAAARKKGSYFGTLYHRIAARRGKKRAAVAVAHAILVTIYHMLKRKTDYVDLGETYLDELHRERSIRRALKQLQAFGLKVTVEAA